ncbi:MAG: heme-copper oxidase subunit III [Flavobacteriales bacterium]|nr:heme-copper oxidase subunit III [Flavobacteriales bacterium]
MTSVSINNQFDTAEDIKKKTAKPLLWIAIVSIVMLFGGWTSAVIVSKGSSPRWFSFDLPFAFTISTLIIVASSLIFHYGLFSIRKGNSNVLKLASIITLVLGVMFIVSQYYGWKDLYSNGIFATGSKSTSASSFIYLVTVFHVLHLLAGIISVLVVAIKSLKEKYNQENTLGVELSIIYWHFLGGLWIYLFLFLKYVA